MPNTHKCEIIANNFELVDQHPVFCYFKRVQGEDMTILGTPALPGMAADKIRQEKIVDLERVIKRLSTSGT